MNKRLRLFWLGLFFEVMGWHFLSRMFGPVDLVGFVFLALGALVLGITLTKNGESRAFGFAWFGRGVLLTLIICLCQWALLPLLMSLAARIHSLPFLAPAISWFFRVAGYQADWHGGSVFLQGTFRIQEFAANLEYLGWTWPVNAACGLLVYLVLGGVRQKLRRLTAFAAVALAYSLVRYLVLALLYLDLPVFGLFWTPWIVGLSFLPLFCFLSGSKWFNPEMGPAGVGGAVDAAEPVGEDGNGRSRLDLPREPWFGGFKVGTQEVLGGFVVAVAAGCFVAAWGWEDPGKVKAGRLIIDDAHSKWEKLDREYDTEWYGEESGYNYYCLWKFLEHYYQVQRSSSKITPALLAGCDILVIKTPTIPFTAEEIDAIEGFVKRGGGLLLIGDHTNVFGTSTVLNAVAHRFGLRFNYDATYDLPTGGLTLYRKPALLPHPIVQRMPPFLFGTSCTLDVPSSAQIAINGYALRVAGHDYSRTSFFSDRTDGPYVGFGMFPQLGAVKFSRGRVAAFTDSTVFSNFWMFVPGKPELLLGCMDWLNRENRFSRWPAILLAFGVLLALFSLRWLGKVFIEKPLFLLACAVPGCLAVVLVVGALNRSAYPAPVPRTPYRSICFDRQYGRFRLPDRSLILEPNLDFHTLYVWTQRVGCVPRVTETLSQAVDSGGGVVVLNPTGVVSPADARRAEAFVERGGALFVFASTAEPLTAANTFLKEFGVGIGPESLSEQLISNAAGETVRSNLDVAVVLGGTGLLFTADRKPVLSIKLHGKGVVAFGGSSELFAAISLGTVNRVPDADQKRLYAVIFQLFRQVERPGL